LRFWITGKSNFIVFKEKIKIIHPEKILKLRQMISAG